VDKLKVSTANLVILIAGVVMLISSFLAFNKFSTPSATIGSIHIGGSVTYSAWSSHFFLIATIPALIGIVMAAHVAVVAFASGVKLPDTVLGLTWDQIHLVLAAQATIMMLAFLIQSTSPLDKGIGLFGMLIAAIGLLVGAVLRTREAPAAPPVV
jgi:hypothetical protein